jgi:response regulator RpfG family c-di-GMP phosphodiesterase
MAGSWDVGMLRFQDRPHAVLFLDDDPETLSALRRGLRDEPYEVLTTLDPAEALAILTSRPVDVVVTDQFMPSIAGTEFLRDVAARAPAAVRVVLTGHPDRVPFQAGLEGRVHWLVTKPWSLRELRQTLIGLLASESRQ